VAVFLEQFSVPGFSDILAHNLELGLDLFPIYTVPINLALELFNLGNLNGIDGDRRKGRGNGKCMQGQ